MSSNPDAQAGKRGDRVLDEFALHPDPKKLYTIAYPGITWGGRWRFFNAPRQRQLFQFPGSGIVNQGNPKRFSLHTATLQDALDQGLLYKLQRKLPPEDPRQQMGEGEYFDFLRAGCPDEETFLQEYMCVPGDDRAAFLSYDLIAGCEFPAGEPWEWTAARASEPGSELFLGVDIGRDHDLTVFWLLEKAGGVFYTRRIETMRGAPFDAQEEALDQLLRSPAARRCCVDQTGIGRQFSSAPSSVTASAKWRASRSPPLSRKSWPIRCERRLNPKRFESPPIPRFAPICAPSKRDVLGFLREIHGGPRQERPRGPFLGAGAGAARRQDAQCAGAMTL